jgi:hypothetical protein
MPPDLETSKEEFLEKAKNIAEMASGMRDIERANYYAARTSQQHGFGWLTSAEKEPDRKVDEYGLPMPPPPQP